MENCESLTKQSISPKGGLSRTSNSNSTLPNYTELHTSSPNAAGIPVLEIVQKLVEEKILSRDDRLALKDALYDPERRDKIVKALCDAELSMNSKFAIKKLKVQIHQNPSGEAHYSENQLQTKQLKMKSQFADNNRYNLTNEDISTQEDSILIDSMKIHNLNGILSTRTKNVRSNKKMSTINEDKSSQNKNSPTNNNKSELVDIHFHGHQNNHNINLDADIFDNMDVQATVNQVVGECPMYSGPNNFNVCEKISLRLQDIMTKYDPSKLNKIKFAVLVGSGSFNPLTRMHVRTFFLAKQYLEMRLGYLVLGSLLSPAHGATVRERYRTNPSEIMPSPHRLAISQLLVQSSRWLSIDPWEITRRRAMDYLSLLEHSAAMLNVQFPETEVKVLYVCKPNVVPKLSPHALRVQNFACVCVCRTPESDNLRVNLGAKWNGLIHVVEDSAILDASLDIVTSRKVRDKVKAGENVGNLVGDKVQDYFMVHRIGPKMNGEESWNNEEKQLPKIISRPAEPALRSQSVGSYGSSMINRRSLLHSNNMDLESNSTELIYQSKSKDSHEEILSKIVKTTTNIYSNDLDLNYDVTKHGRKGPVDMATDTKQPPHRLKNVNIISPSHFMKPQLGGRHGGIIQNKESNLTFENIKNQNSHDEGSSHHHHHHIAYKPSWQNRTESNHTNG